jgi:acylphosphatase
MEEIVMYDDKRVDVTVHKDGTVSVEAFGFKGAACEKMLEMVTKHFGNEISSEEKPEFFEAAVEETVCVYQ